jgi:hypothetical protein
MFTTDGHMYDTTRERVDIRGITRTIAACHGNLHRLTAHTFMGWAFYDSRLAPKAPGLGAEDWLADAKDEGAKCGVRLVTYFNMLGYLEDHPHYGKYDVLDERGAPVVIYRVVRAACVNTPWRDFVLDVVAEVFERYAPDGMYVDWAQKACWCPRCRAAFREAAGYDLPTAAEVAAAGIPSSYSWPEGLEAIDDARLRAYAAWQQQVRDDTLKAMGRVATGIRPDAATLYHLFPPLDDQSWYDATLIEGGEKSRPAEIWQTHERATAARHYEVPLYVNLFYNRGAPAEELRHRAFQVLASGGFPNVINVPNEDYRALPGIAEACRLVAEHPDVYDFGATRPSYSVLLPRDPWEATRHRRARRAAPMGFAGEQVPVAAAQAERGDDVGSEQMGPRGGPLAFPASHVHRFMSAYQGMAGALLLSGIPFASVDPQRVAASLPRTGVLCLANEAAMRDTTVRAVREFVAAGGGLVATFETSLFDEHGRRREDFALADVFGVHLAGPAAMPLGQVGVYDLHLVAETPGSMETPHPVLGNLGRTARVPYPEMVLPVRPADGAAVLIGVRRPPPSYYPATGDHIGRLRDSLMAGDPADLPFAVAHTYGKGRVVYFAGRPDSAYLHWGIPEQRQWLANAVRWVAGGALPVRVRAAAPVGVGLFEQPDRWVIHLVNYGGSLTTPLEFAPPPLADVAVDVCPPAGMAVVGVRALVSGRQLDVRYGGESGGAGGATVVMPRLRVYEALVVDVRRRG